MDRMNEIRSIAVEVEPDTSSASLPTRIDRDLVRAELDRLERDGKLMPEHVVDFARDPSTALHSCFTWDDGEAAERWRLHEARQVIRVCVRIIDDGPKEPIRAFVALRSDVADGGGYRPIGSVLSDADLRESLLSQAKADAKAWAKRYRQLTELAEVFEAIDRLDE